LSGDVIRIDKWLWFARFCKSRAQAQELIARDQVLLNKAPVEKPAVTVRVGDTIAIVLGPVRRTVTVRGLGERRGPAAEARALYDEPAPPERLSREDAALPLHKRHSPFS
jgi:ribosome-associated heat shock protein Hsp15